VNGHLSFLVVGVDIDALAVHRVEHVYDGFFKKRFKKLTYGPAFARALVGYRPPTLVVEVDGKRVAGTCGFVFVANTRNYAGLLSLDPAARIDDRLLEVYLFPTGRLFELGRAFVRGVLRHLPGGAVRMVRGAAVRVTSDVAVPFEIDGDAGGTTPVELALGPNQYRLVVP
jgi:diacylglycerol kinase family enzyme